jgi:hypothetical protein
MIAPPERSAADKAAHKAAVVDKHLAAVSRLLKCPMNTGAVEAELKALRIAVDSMDLKEVMDAVATFEALHGIARTLLEIYVARGLVLSFGDLAK